MRRSLLRAAAFAAKRASAPSSALCTRAAPARQFGLVAGGCGLGNAVAARSLLPAAARLLHTSPTALAGGRPSLEETLKEELAHEQGDYDTPEARCVPPTYAPPPPYFPAPDPPQLVKQGPPPPFKLSETPGGRVLARRGRGGSVLGLIRLAARLSRAPLARRRSPSPCLSRTRRRV